MKYALSVAAIAIVLCAGLCYAEGESCPEVCESGEMAQDEADAADSSAPVEIVGCPGEETSETVDQVGVMSQAQDYDSNSGFPDVVKSDSDAELE